MTSELGSGENCRGGRRTGSGSARCRDIAATWGKKLPRLATTELFVRAVVTNIFNNAARTRGDIGINTRLNNAAYQAFNPFTTAPVQGVHWDFSPTFGEPQAFDDYQVARTFSFSAGIRF